MAPYPWPRQALLAEGRGAPLFELTL